MFRILEYESLPSTNDMAKRLARSGAAHGTAVTAREQTSGRGQHGRAFVSPPGGLYLSLILRPDIPPSRLAHVTALAGVAVCRAVRAVCPALAPRIKPINDVRINGRKLCGILVEISSTGGRTDFAVIGIGVNVEAAPPDVGQEVISLAEAAGAAGGESVSVAVFRDALLAQLEGLEEILHRQGETAMENAGGEPPGGEWIAEYKTLLEGWQ